MFWGEPFWPSSSSRLLATARGELGFLGMNRSGWSVRLLMYFDRSATLESAASGIPVDFVSHHCPGNNSDLSGQCNGCFLFACPLSPVNVIVGLLRPLVVPQGAPGALHQDGSQQPATSLGDMPVAIGLSGLILLRDQA